MEYLFLHGLGQTVHSWDETLSHADISRQAVCPELFSLLKEGKADYQTLYCAFTDYCNQRPAKMNLCGLSLGAVLALNYAVDHPENVSSLVLIAPQFQMPKILLRVQDVLFRFMPGKAFQEMGIGKESFRNLTNSMLSLDFSNRLKDISCPVLILCGEKDRANRKAAESLAKTINGAKLHVIKNAGHEVNTQAPIPLAEILMDFYNQ